MVKTIALALAFIAALLLYAATRPDSFKVQRAIGIKAPPEKVFALVDDPHRWDAWTPNNKDPLVKKTYLGAHSSVGAAYAWEGKVKVTPLGGQDGEFCAQDRAMIFEDQNGTRILYDAGRTVAGAKPLHARLCGFTVPRKKCSRN